MIVLAIDPGPTESAWLLYATSLGRPRQFAFETNDELLRKVRARTRWGSFPDVVVIEQVRSYGMSVGAEIFDTVFVSGQLAEAARPTPVVQLPRLAVKQAICHDSRAKDANIRAALLDRFGGKAAAIGRKSAPGPLYGITGDLWSALAIAITYAGNAA